MQKPTIKALNFIRKKYKIPKNAPIPLKLYKEACSISLKDKKTLDFNFAYSLKSISSDFAQVDIVGNHLSKNRVDSLSFKDKIRYKKAFKKASYDFYLLNKNMLQLFNPGHKMIFLDFLFYNQRSRDHDNNSENIKRVIDTLVSIGLLSNDTRDKVKTNSFEEIISNNLKISVILRTKDYKEQNER